MDKGDIKTIKQELALTKPIFSGTWIAIIAGVIVGATLTEYFIAGVLGYGLVLGLVAICWMAFAFMMDRAFAQAINNLKLELAVNKAVAAGLADLMGTLTEDNGLTLDQEESNGNSIH